MSAKEKCHGPEYTAEECMKLFKIEPERHGLPSRKEGEKKLYRESDIIKLIRGLFLEQETAEMAGVVNLKEWE